MTSTQDSHDGMTTAEESQDTPDASMADTQEDQDKEATVAAGKKKKGKQPKKPKAKLPIFTGLPPALVGYDGDPPTEVAYIFFVYYKLFRLFVTT